MLALMMALALMLARAKLARVRRLVGRPVDRQSLGRGLPRFVAVCGRRRLTLDRLGSARD
jgi:hypothetical protein